MHASSSRPHTKTKTPSIHLEHDDDDAERADVAGESEHLDLLADDRRAGGQELDEHDDRAVQVHVGVVQRELDEDGARPHVQEDDARPHVQPVVGRQLVELGDRHPRVAPEVERVTAAL